MPKVLIVMDADSDRAVTTRMVSAFKQAILSSSTDVETITGLGLRQRLSEGTQQLDDLLCPLSLDIPEDLNFAQQSLFSACRDVMDLRQQVEQKLQCSTGVGEFWLPIVLTAKGPLYAEAITTASTDPVHYLQPFHLHDRWRQPLYLLGHRLLKLLAATPATYLMQFGFQGDTIVFDRLFPFPAAPAVASVNVQSPDLFTCHWYCLNRIPLLDLTIVPPNP